MEMAQKQNKGTSSLRRGLRQIGCAALALVALTGAAQAATDEVVYFHTDALGSPVAAFSEAGEVCWIESYSPYGEKLANEDSYAPAEGCGLLSTDVGYTGHVQDGSGLVYAQQRYYDPQIGRFMSTDPVAAGASSPNMFGRYHYANNSPYRYTDPDGEIPLDYAVDGISVGISAAIYANEPTFWNGFALGVDSILAALPYVPAGIGLIRGVDKGVDAASAANEANYLYRGVSADHPALDAAKRGDVIPGNVNGSVTPELHNAGGYAQDSPFTSWSRDPDIAAYHAAKAGDGGVILRVPQGAPKAGSQWNWQWSPDIYGEQEVLMQGIRTGVDVLK